MPSTRLSPARSLQKLRTVFSLSESSTRSAEPASPSPLTLSNNINININTSTTAPKPTTSPLSSPTLTLTPTVSPTPSSGFAGFAGFTFGNAAPSPLFNSPEGFFDGAVVDSRRVIRRKKSCVEIEIERERYEVDGKLVGVVEPRPVFGLGMGFGSLISGGLGIEEVLCGEV
jgi:hypothetical protein